MVNSAFCKSYNVLKILCNNDLCNGSAIVDMNLKYLIYVDLNYNSELDVTCD